MESCLDFNGKDLVTQPHPTKRKAGEDVYLNTFHEGGENELGRMDLHGQLVVSAAP